MGVAYILSWILLGIAVFVYGVHVITSKKEGKAREGLKESLFGVVTIVLNIAGLVALAIYLWHCFPTPHGFSEIGLTVIGVALVGSVTGPIVVGLVFVLMLGCSLLKPSIAGWAIPVLATCVIVIGYKTKAPNGHPNQQSQTVASYYETTVDYSGYDTEIVDQILDENTFVYVCPSSTGKRYHGYSACSGLRNCYRMPLEVLRETAVKEGRTPCRKCYDYMEAEILSRTDQSINSNK